MQIVLETRSLVLRPWKADDLDHLVAGLNDIRVAQWLAFVPHPYSGADASKWIDHCLRLSTRNDAPPAHEFAIERKLDHAMVGGVSLNGIDAVAGSAGGGIWIAAQHQRRGYGREAFGERIRFAFETLRLRELRNGYFSGNEPSWDLQRSFGYRRAAAEPVRRHCMADGSWKNEVTTILRREDWIRT